MKMKRVLALFLSILAVCSVCLITKDIASPDVDLLE